MQGDDRDTVSRAIDRDATPAAPISRRRTRKKRGRTFTVISAVCSVLGVGMIIAAFALPDVTEKVTGAVTVAVTGTYENIRSQVAVITGQPESATLPSVELGPVGTGEAALDGAGWRQFIELTDYRVVDIPPVFAAHNNRGGDILLNWEIGQRVYVSDDDGGRGGTYEVAGDRFTPKWGPVTQLAGMTGDLILQSCFYGEDRMRFVSLIRVE
ncbi:hypothetical protein [Microbacterium sp. ZW T5_56]|uniref:hypothetical protein n=1 Tax=Microbacterium sp. ZW T5_56 TaxID=3378081 RepID=UPI003851E65C